MNLKFVMTLSVVLVVLAFTTGAKNKVKVNPNQPTPYGWDQLLDSTNGDPVGCNSDRFTCVMGGDAVRDNETGFVWERQPSLQRFLIPEAMEHCAKDPIAGRFGWHVPTIEQLASLIDPQQSDPALPLLHPFIDVSITFPPETNYYSSTKEIDDLSGHFFCNCVSSLLLGTRTTGFDASARTDFCSTQGRIESMRL